MKKKGIITLIVIVTAMIFNIACAAGEAGAKTPERLKNAIDKISNDVSIKAELKTVYKEKKISIPVSIYVKNARNIIIKGSHLEDKFDMFLDSDEVNVYSSKNNVLFKLEGFPFKMPAYIEAPEVDNGEYYTYTADVKPENKFNEKDLSEKETLYVTKKGGKLYRYSIVNDKGETIHEMTFNEVKTEKHDNAIFQHPENAKKMTLPKNKK